MLERRRQPAQVLQAVGEVVMRLAQAGVEGDGLAPLAFGPVELADRPATPGPGWRALLHGQEISVFVRDGAGAPPTRAKPTRVGGLLSAPGSG